MNVYQVIYTRSVEDLLKALYGYIASQGSPRAADRLIDGILEFCQGLSALPKRGAGRGELRCSFLTITYRKSVVVFYRVDETEVIISAVYYSGQGYEIVEE